MKKLLVIIGILTLFGSSFTAHANLSNGEGDGEGRGETTTPSTSGGGGGVNFMLLQQKAAMELELLDQEDENPGSDDPLLTGVGGLPDPTGITLDDVTPDLPTPDLPPCGTTDGVVAVAPGDCETDGGGGGGEIPCGVGAVALGDCGGTTGGGGGGETPPSVGGGGGVPLLPSVGVEAMKLYLASGFAIFLILSVGILNRERFKGRR